MGDPTSLFAAIIALPCGGAGCFPTVPSLINTSVIASTTFTSGSATSTDHLTPLSTTLAPGNYALVLGGGLSAPFPPAVANPLGSTGSGAVNTFNTLVPGCDVWAEFTGADGITRPPLRFVVEGTVVPEPGFLLLLGAAAAGLLARRR